MMHHVSPALLILLTNIHISPSAGVLEHVHFVSFCSEGGDRADIGDIILIITDGKTTKEAEGLQEEAQLIKDSGKIIMAVGVGVYSDFMQFLYRVTWVFIIR